MVPVLETDTSRYSRLDEGAPVVSSTGDHPLGAAGLYEQIQATDEFVELRTRLRRYVFPMSALFLGWYLLYVLLATFAPGFMSTRLPEDGNLTVGLYIGLAQFLTTFVITTLYVRFANNKLDPAAERLRIEIEGIEHR
jgi:uncharacterized membrane protein (DUF485 family)